MVWRVRAFQRVQVQDAGRPGGVIGVSIGMAEGNEAPMSTFMGWEECEVVGEYVQMLQAPHNWQSRGTMRRKSYVSFPIVYSSLPHVKQAISPSFFVPLPCHSHT